MHIILLAIMLTPFLLLQYDHARISALSERLIKGITSQVDNVFRNGDPAGFPGCVNLSFAYIEGESFLMAMKVCLILPGRYSIHNFATEHRIVVG